MLGRDRLGLRRASSTVRQTASCPCSRCAASSSSISRASPSPSDDDLGRPAGQVDRRRRARPRASRRSRTVARARRSCRRAATYASQPIACGPPSAHTSSMPSSSAAAAIRPAPAGGVQTTMRRDAGHLRGHGAHDERRDEVARHVDADGVERHPAPFEHDARLDLERDVRRTLHLVPAADAVGERRGSPRAAARRRRHGARRLDAVELERPLANRLGARARLMSATIAHAAIRSTGTIRIDERAGRLELAAAAARPRPPARARARRPCPARPAAARSASASR